MSFTALEMLNVVGPGLPPSSIVLTPGGSRTADIEQRIIRGMHGPKEFDILLYGDGPPAPAAA